MTKLTNLFGVLVFTALTVVASPSFAADFSGTWVLDLKASDSLDELLKAQGVSWMKRKAIAGLKVTQTVSQTDNQVTIETSSSRGNRSQTLQVDGETREVEQDRGTAQVRHEWRGDDLQSTSELPKDGGVLTSVRSLSEDGKTLTQSLILKKSDGSTIEVARIFRRS